MTPPRRSSDPWAQLRDEYMRVVIETTGAPPDIAIRAASLMVRVFQQTFGGESVYVPRPPRYDAEAVLRDFTGNNAQEVMARHGIPRESFYRLLRRRGRALPNDGTVRVVVTVPATDPKPLLPRRPPKPTDFNW